MDSLVLTLRDLLEYSNVKKVFDILKDTKSFLTRGPNEIPRIQDVTKHYIEKYPQLATTQIKVVPNYPNAVYNMNTKVLILGVFNADILSHELHHVMGLENSPIHTKILAISKMIAAVTTPLSLASPIAIGAKAIAPQWRGGINAILDALAVTHGVSYLPTLLEEGRASINAAAESKDKMETAKALGPSYMSYLPEALGPMGLYQLARRL